MTRFWRIALVAALCLLGIRTAAGAERRSVEDRIERSAERYAYSKWPAPPAGLFSSLDFDDLWKVVGDRGFLAQKQSKRGGGWYQYDWTTAGEPKVTGSIGLWMFDSAAAARRGLLSATGWTSPAKEALYQDPPVGEVLVRPLSKRKGVLLFVRRNVLVLLYIRYPKNRYASWVEDVNRAGNDLAMAFDSYLKQLEVVEVEKLGYDPGLSGLEGPFKVGESFVIKSVARRPKQGSDEGKAAQDGYRLDLSILSKFLPQKVAPKVERIDASSFRCTVYDPGEYFVYAQGTWDDYITTGFRQRAVINVEKKE